MKRRAFLQALAVAPVAAAMPTVTSGHILSVTYWDRHGVKHTIRWKEKDVISIKVNGEEYKVPVVS